MALASVRDFVFQEELGRGTYGRVVRATRVPGRAHGFPEVVAIKCVDTKSLNGSAQDNLVEEIRLLKALNHKYIVRMIDFDHDSAANNVYMFLEYCNSGDLRQFLKRQGRLSEEQACVALVQIASALHYLHQIGIAHLDLKPSNILLTKTSPNSPMSLKLADFGFATTVQHGKLDGKMSLRGTLLYMAPEMLRDQRYDSRADLWSTGVILYELVFGQTPFHSTTYDELIGKILDSAPVHIFEGQISNQYAQLLRSLLQRDPSRRSFELFFSHPLVKAKPRPAKPDTGQQENVPGEEILEQPMAAKKLEGPFKNKKIARILSKAKEHDDAGRDISAFRVYCMALDELLAHPYVREKQGTPTHQKIGNIMERAEQLKKQREAMDKSNALERQAILASPSLTKHARECATAALDMIRKAENRDESIQTEAECAVLGYREGTALLLKVVEDNETLAKDGILLRRIKVQIARTLSRAEQIHDLYNNPFTPPGSNCSVM
eukprot:m.95678 g.95678  ORF g.95678 m.95678 type:complete len:493 (-) comp13506_c1_seq3:96-1574(-)